MFEPTPRVRHIPRELLVTAGFALAIFVVVLAGAGICSLMTAPAGWQALAAYAGPAAVAFAVYWIVAHRLKW